MLFSRENVVSVKICTSCTSKRPTNAYFLINISDKQNVAAMLIAFISTRSTLRQIALGKKGGVRLGFISGQRNNWELPCKKLRKYFRKYFYFFFPVHLNMKSPPNTTSLNIRHNFHSFTRFL